MRYKDVQYHENSFSVYFMFSLDIILYITSSEMNE